MGPLLRDSVRVPDPVCHGFHFKLESGPDINRRLQIAIIVTSVKGYFKRILLPGYSVS